MLSCSVIRNTTLLATVSLLVNSYKSRGQGQISSRTKFHGNSTGVFFILGFFFVVVVLIFFLGEGGGVFHLVAITEDLKNKAGLIS